MEDLEPRLVENNTNRLWQNNNNFWGNNKEEIMDEQRIKTSGMEDRNIIRFQPDGDSNWKKR